MSYLDVSLSYTSSFSVTLTLTMEDETTKTLTLNEGDMVNNLVYKDGSEYKTITGRVRVINFKTKAATTGTETCYHEATSSFNKYFTPISLNVDYSDEYDGKVVMIPISDIKDFDEVSDDGTDESEDPDTDDTGDTEDSDTGDTEPSVELTEELTTASGSAVSVSMDTLVVDIEETTEEVTTILTDSGVDTTESTVLLVTDVSLTDEEGNTVTVSEVSENGVQVTINIDGVTAESSYYVLHLLSDSETWEILIPDEIGDGYIKVTFTSLSPIVVVEGEVPDTLVQTTVELKLDPMAIAQALMTRYYNIYTSGTITTTATSTRYSFDENFTSIGNCDNADLTSITVNGTEYNIETMVETNVGKRTTLSLPPFQIVDGVLYIVNSLLIMSATSDTTVITTDTVKYVISNTSGAIVNSTDTLSINSVDILNTTVNHYASSNIEGSTITTSTSHGTQLVAVTLSDSTGNIIDDSSLITVAVDSDGKMYLSDITDYYTFSIYPYYNTTAISEESTTTHNFKTYVLTKGVVDFNMIINLVIYNPSTVYLDNYTDIKNYLNDKVTEKVVLTSDITSTSSTCITLSGTTNGKMEKTLDLAGYSVTGASGLSSSSSAIKVTNNAILNIIDSVGTSVVNGGGQCSSNVAVWSVGSDSIVNIYGGSYNVDDDSSSSGNSTIYAEGGTINIYGGTFRNNTSKPKFTLNIKNNTGYSFIYCYGGTYINCNPADGDDADKTYGATFLADGYTVTSAETDEGTAYTVVASTDTTEA